MGSVLILGRLNIPLKLSLLYEGLFYSIVKLGPFSLHLHGLSLSLGSQLIILILIHVNKIIRILFMGNKSLIIILKKTLGLPLALQFLNV